MADLVFHTNPMSRGRIVRWMLEEVGARYETHVVGWDENRGEAYRAVNPMMKVPVIVHRGRTVTETAAICAYLAETFPDAGLAPRSDDERAAYYRWMFFAAGPVEAAIANQALGVEVPTGKEGMIGYGSYDRTVDTLEEAVSTGAFVAGDRFTAADVYVGSHIGFGTGFGGLPKRDAFMAYLARVTDRPAYRRAAEIDDALIAEMQQGG